MSGSDHTPDQSLDLRERLNMKKFNRIAKNLVQQCLKDVSIDKKYIDDGFDEDPDDEDVNRDDEEVFRDAVDKKYKHSRSFRDRRSRSRDRRRSRSQPRFDPYDPRFDTENPSFSHCYRNESFSHRNESDHRSRMAESRMRPDERDRGLSSKYSPDNRPKELDAYDRRRRSKSRRDRSDSDSMDESRRSSKRRRPDDEFPRNDLPHYLHETSNDVPRSIKNRLGKGNAPKKNLNLGPLLGLAMKEIKKQDVKKTDDGSEISNLDYSTASMRREMTRSGRETSRSEWEISRSEREISRSEREISRSERETSRPGRETSRPGRETSRPVREKSRSEDRANTIDWEEFKRDKKLLSEHIETLKVGADGFVLIILVH